MPARNALVHTNPESHMQSVTDRQTEGQQDDVNRRSYCVAVGLRSAKNEYLKMQIALTLIIFQAAMCAVICVSIQDLWAGGMNVHLLLKSDSGMYINPLHVTVLCDHRMPVNCAKSIGRLTDS